MSHVWKEPAIPRHVVQMIPVDQTGSILVMHRSNTVRSARNVWSFPSGMHEIGHEIHEEVRRELIEEYALHTCRSLPCKGVRYLGVYENVAGDHDAKEQYHWVITVVAALVGCPVSTAVNKEPDKHDQFKIVSCKDLTEDFLNAHPFHKSFDQFARPRLDFLRGELRMAALLIPRD